MAAYISMGEAHRRITEYLTRFSDAISSQDGKSLSRLLSVSSDSPALLSLADALNTFQVALLLVQFCISQLKRSYFQLTQIVDSLICRVVSVVLVPICKLLLKRIRNWKCKYVPDHMQIRLNLMSLLLNCLNPSMIQCFRVLVP